MAVYTYQWMRCDASGASCVDILGATGASYSAVAADVGSTLRVRVNDGTTTKTSPQTAVIEAEAPTPIPPGAMGSSISSYLNTGGWVNGRLTPSAGSVVTCASLSAFQTAWNAASSGTIIELMDGTYWLTTYHKHFSPSNPVTIRPAAGQNSVIIRIPQANGYHGFFFGDCTGVRITRGTGNERLIFDGSHYNGIRLSNCVDFELDAMIFRNNPMIGLLAGTETISGATNPYSTRIATWDTIAYNNGHLGADNSNGDQVHNYYMGGNATSGAAPYGLLKLLMVNTLSYHAPGGYCIQLGGSLQDALICNTTADDAPSSPYAGAMTMYSDGVQIPRCNHVIVKNLIVTRGFAAGLTASGSSSAPLTNVVDYLVGFGNGTYGDFHAGTMWGTYENHLHGDPLYHDSTNATLSARDYRLNAGSPAIGYADANYCWPFDVFGNPRAVASSGAVAPV